MPAQPTLAVARACHRPAQQLLVAACGVLVAAMLATGLVLAVAHSAEMASNPGASPPWRSPVADLVQVYDAAPVHR